MTECVARAEADASLVAARAELATLTAQVATMKASGREREAAAAASVRWNEELVVDVARLEARLEDTGDEMAGLAATIDEERRRSAIVIQERVTAQRATVVAESNRQVLLQQLEADAVALRETSVALHGSVPYADVCDSLGALVESVGQSVRQAATAWLPAQVAALEEVVTSQFWEGVAAQGTVLEALVAEARRRYVIPAAMPATGDLFGSSGHGGGAAGGGGASGTGASGSAGA